jgi:2-dehydropantoate 2-reductase
VAHAHAIQLPLDDLYDWLLEVCRKTAENLSPMLQDILNNRPTEIESLNGAIYSMGKHKGVLAPLHQTMTELIRLFEKWGGGREFEG